MNPQKQLLELVGKIANELSGIAISDMETAERRIVKHLVLAGFGKIHDEVFRKIN